MLRIITNLASGAPAREAVFLTDALRTRGFDSRLAWGCAPPGAGSQDPRAGLPNTYLPWLSSGVHLGDDARATAALRGIAKRWHPDVVHTHLAKAGMLGRAAGLRAHVPVLVHTFHGDGAGRATEGRIERALSARTDALIATTSAARDRLRAMGIGSDRSWHVIPVGVCLDPFLGTGIGRAAARHRLGLPPDDAVVLSLGSLDDRGVFLRAARTILANRRDTTFVVVRDGPVSDDAVLDARSILGERVRFLPRADDLPLLFAACDVAVLTSCGEDAPSVLIEAAAARTPVVAADTGGVREVVSDGVGGDLVSMGDHRATAAAVCALAEDPARAASYAEAGHAHVRTRFSSDRLAADLAGLYAELLDRRSVVAPRSVALTSARGS